MARNRKRAKERRSRRPQSDAGIATARAGRDERRSTPTPLEHGTPDVEFAEAQLALGRPELTGEQTPAEIEAIVEAEEDEDERHALEIEDERQALEGYEPGIPGLIPGRPQIEHAADDLEEPELASTGGRGGRRRGGGRRDGSDDDSAGGELAPVGGTAPAARVFPGTRLVNFLLGCWRELQRVQWPDRGQVVQATGVVIGFVIFAGLFLGGADWVAGKLVSFILK